MTVMLTREPVTAPLLAAPVIPQITQRDVADHLGKLTAIIEQLREVRWDLEDLVKTGEFTPRATEELTWALAPITCLADDVRDMAARNRAA